MATSKCRNEITVIEARQSDVTSLTTIVARSFYPVNPYIKQTFPDTPTIRAWWSRIFQNVINSSSCHVLAAIDPDTDKDIGILILRLLGPDERGAGFWTMYDWTEDHDEAKVKAMIDAMVEYRERMMLGRSHFSIELFGVDHDFKGRGVGTKLLARACEIADRAGYDVFVQANASARDFYARLGFGVEGETVMPGEGEYRECMMVRRCSKS